MRRVIVYLLFVCGERNCACACVDLYGCCSLFVEVKKKLCGFVVLSEMLLFYR